MADTEQNNEAAVEETQPQNTEAENQAAQAPENTEAQDASEQPAAESASGEPKAEPKIEAKRKEHWAHSRINELTAQKKQAEEAKRQVEEELARIKSAGEKEKENKDPAKVALDPKDLQKFIAQEAEKQRRVEKFNTRANEVYNAGAKEFDDFPDAVANLQAVGALGESGNPNFVSIVTELDDGHKVLHHLGKNPEEAARILSLSPTKMAVELTKLETNLNSKQIAVSKAPKPVKPVTGTAKSSVDLASDDVPVDQWMKERAKQRQERYASR